MALRTLTFLALVHIFTAKIMVLDNLEDLRELQQGFQKGAPAMGFQLDRGLIWSIICNSRHGMVPGKMDSRGEGWYPWGGREWGCNGSQIVRAVQGRLVSWDQPLPGNCQAQGSQFDSGPYHAALIQSQHGLVPGKAKKSRNEAWYSWGGREISVRSNYYFIC